MHPTTRASIHPCIQPSIHLPTHACFQPSIQPLIHPFIHSVNSVLEVSSIVGATLSDRTVEKTNQPKTYSKKNSSKSVYCHFYSQIMQCRGEEWKRKRRWVGHEGEEWDDCFNKGCQGRPHGKRKLGTHPQLNSITGMS